MYKKIISLILSFTILIESYPSFAQGINLPNNYLENDDGTSSYENEEYSDYCKNYPKNKFGQTSDVDCAVMNKIKQFRVSTQPQSKIKNTGRYGEIDVHFWKYIGLSRLAETFNDLLEKSYKNINKNEFIKEFISQTNDFFNISSIESAAVAKKWVEKSKYSKVAGFTQKDIENWSKDLLKEIIINREKVKDNSFMKGFLCGGTGFFATVITLVKIAGAALLGSTGVGCIAGALLGLGGYFWGKADVAEEIGKQTRKAREQADMYDLRAGVYYLALEYILDAISKKEWIGNDLLVAQLDFDKYEPCAYVDFRNVKIRNTPNWDFEVFFGNLSRTLSELIKKYKEEL